MYERHCCQVVDQEEMMGSLNVANVRVSEVATAQFQGGVHNHYNFVLGDYDNCVLRVLDFAF